VKIFGESLSVVLQAVEDVSDEHYDGNVIAVSYADRSNERAKRCSLALGVIDDRGPGARFKSHRRERVAGEIRSGNACWHAHFDILDELFFVNRPIRVDTAKAKYTSSNFVDVSYSTATEIVCADGRRMVDLCACGEDAWPFDENYLPYARQAIHVMLRREENLLQDIPCFRESR
jgi:hypothetical protein